MLAHHAGDHQKGKVNNKHECCKKDWLRVVYVMLSADAEFAAAVETPTRPIGNITP